jgi:Fic family protein
MDLELLVEPLSRCRYQQGILYQKVESIGLDLELEAQLESMTLEAVQTAAIEGEFIDPQGVRSSVARKLGLPTAGLPPAGREAEGMVEILMDATGNYRAPLTEERLKGWHAALFPTGYSGLHKIRVADLRGSESDPMRVVSGPIGREKVHYVAPPAETVKGETKKYLEWWEKGWPGKKVDPILRAGVAHYWFLAIHPFEDGNGRIARALTDMALAQVDGARKRCYSLSAQIVKDRESYYQVLDRTSKGDGDLTVWLAWFLGCLEQAVLDSQVTVEKVLGIARFWQNVAGLDLNKRQKKGLQKLLEAGPGGFEGGLKPHKFKNMTGASRATVNRDISDLVAKGVLVPGEAGGRSTSYDLNWELTRTVMPSWVKKL